MEDGSVPFSTRGGKVKVNLLKRERCNGELLLYVLRFPIVLDHLFRGVLFKRLRDSFPWKI